MSSSQNKEDNDEHDFDRLILKKVADDNELSVGSKRLNTLGDIFILFLSQSLSSMINDMITSMGLDGRIDVLIFLIALSIMLFSIYSYIQKWISHLNRESKLFIMGATRLKLNKILKKESSKYTQDKINTKVLSYLSSIYITYKHQFSWRRFIISIFEFLAMVSGILMTYYSQKCLSLFLNNLNVSVYTALLPATVLFFYMIALKTAFLPSSVDGDYEKILTSEDVHMYMEKELRLEDM